MLDPSNDVDTIITPQPPDVNLNEALWADIDVELGQVYERATNTEDLILMLNTA